MIKNKNKIVSLLAVALTTVILVLSVYFWNKPVKYVGLDGQSSIGLTLNVFNRIIRAESIGNETDIIFIEGLNKQLKNKDINEGILSAIDVMEQSVSFNHKTDDVLIISVWTSVNKDAEKMKVQLQNIVSIYAEQIGYSVDVQGMILTDESYEIAFNSGISSARYQILERIKAELDKQIAMEKANTKELESVVAPRNNYVVESQPIVKYVTITSPEITDDDDDDDDDDEHYDEQDDD
ncbi:MAG: hypothetical protein PHQ32_00120 [Firmicutes bacterium]|nr:hypothetical protein [Bacillota bacterium]